MEQLSALMDGELDDHEVAAELARIKGDPDRVAAWAAFHLIGDALRGDGVAADDLTDRVRVRLNAEPTVVAPRRWMRRATQRVALPLAASLCGAAVVAWLALSNNAILSPQDNTGAAGIIAASPQITEQTDPSDADAMSEYLMAHQQFSPSTAMQGVVPYVRTVSSADSSR